MIDSKICEQATSCIGVGDSGTGHKNKVLNTVKFLIGQVVPVIGLSLYQKMVIAGT